MGTIDFKRESDYETLKREWKSGLRIIGELPHEKSWNMYFSLESGFKHIPHISNTNTVTVRYNEEKQMIVCKFEYLPGIKSGTIVEIHNVIDETDAHFKFTNFFTMILIELCKLTPNYTIEQLIQNNEESVSWAKNYVGQK